MATCVVNSGRFTSKDIVIQYLPCGAEGNHVQELIFNATGGTFKLRVNGFETASITYNATVATFLTSINAALDALPNLDPADIVASGAASSHITLTAAADLGWFTIVVSTDALTGNLTADPNVSTHITTQGSKLYTLSAQVSKFDFEVSTDVVDATAISEYETTELPVKESMTFDLSLYKAREDWTMAVRSGKRGIMYVYEQGKVADGAHEFFAFWALFDKVSVSFPDHELVEADMSGVRQGAMVVDFGSIYA